jgi:hypothetical protein
VIEFVRDLWQVGGFLQIFEFIITPPINSQIIEHKKDHDIWLWKSNSWPERGTKMVGLTQLYG